MTRNTLRVRITKCSGKNWWYKDRIGQELLVHSYGTGSYAVAQRAINAPFKILQEQDVIVLEEDVFKVYIGTKIIKAKPMVKAAFDRMKGTACIVSNTEEGYLVEYEDGYKSWSPKDTFERCYRELSVSEQALMVSLGVNSK